MQDQSAFLRADPRLSKFDPLPRILFYDDFDEGMRGWSGLIGNYEDTLDSVLPAFADLRPPMLSNGTMWDTGETRSHFHLAPAGWEDVPGGAQGLCYNEIATNYNWHYLRVDLDIGVRRIVRFVCGDRDHDLTGIEPMVMPAMPNLQGMLNVAFWAEADTDRRAFLYVDSALLSGEEAP